MTAARDAGGAAMHHNQFATDVPGAGGAATEATAWMVDCGNENIAEGDVRFFRAARKYEAHGCALAHGTKAVPLYEGPTPPADGPEAEPRSGRMAWHLRQAEQRIAELRAEVGVQSDAAEVERARFQRLLLAFHDATRRPLGVTPASGDEFYDYRLAMAAEERRPRVGTEPERRERPEVHLVAVQREKAAALGLLDGQASVVRQLEREKAAAETALAEARAENDRLRTLLATSDAPCPYCALPADRMAECAHGFPGCGRADDMMPDPAVPGSADSPSSERGDPA